nr:RNA-directed DNA polymerase, eukaryota, nucleotide-binding alpha-beta plait domain protein [Tanacetum cinerariifolium]
MSDFPNDNKSFLNLLGMSNPNTSSSSNSSGNQPRYGFPNQFEFPPPTPEQLLQFQQQHHQQQLNMDFQNLQQNPPLFPQQEQPQSQSSQATTEPTPSIRRLKRASKNIKNPFLKKNPDVSGCSLRWQLNEETLLAALVGNLCTLWIGRMHLYANVVRFERTPSGVPRPSQPVRKATHTGNTFASVVK